MVFINVLSLLLLRKKVKISIPQSAARLKKGIPSYKQPNITGITEITKAQEKSILFGLRFGHRVDRIEVTDITSGPVKSNGVNHVAAFFKKVV